MAEPFKNLLDVKVVRALAAELERAWPAFPRRRFITDATRGLDALELKARAQHISNALSAALPDDATRAMEVLVRALGPPLEVTEGYGSTVFRYLPYSTFLFDVGPRDLETALEANRQLTMRFSAEFSIRALLEHAPARTLSALARWTKDENPHVRRLVSEGTRPRLPWAPRVRALAKDPLCTLPLLEALKDDPEEYVRRSVANHLNDLSKDVPERILDVAARWLEQSKAPARRRLVEHGLRTLVKAGDPRALALLGATGVRLDVRGQVTPKRVRLGDRVTLKATVENRGRVASHVVAEAVVHYARPTGSAAKTFRLGRVDLEPGASVTLTKRLRLVHVSIRRLHPGLHRVEVQANGTRVDAGHFTLTP
ncbi:MAG: DNA alkylation repair protein [Myxococcaceae bacterium]|nr:DNA alkylation repair protein [Myxococcaceae bacterium]